MKITQTKYQKNNPQRVSIFVDEKYLFSVHVDNLIKFDLYKEKEITEQEIQEIILYDLQNRLYDRCINYLARGFRTEFQIRKYIKKILYEKSGDWYPKDSDLDLLQLEDLMIEKMNKNNYIDDERFAYAYARTVTDNRACSRYYLTGMMMQKGVDPKLASQISEEVIDDEVSVAEKALFKKYRKKVIEPGQQKEIQFLQRKGFNWEIISKLIKNDIQR